jgi:RNA polymerase sigma-70 factor (ECF subfamily)
VSPRVFASPLALATITEIPDVEERAGFTFLYEHHAPRVQRFLRDLLGDGALAWDATQETFARAFRNRRDLLRDRARAVPWLFGVARKVSLEMRKARYRSAQVVVAHGESTLGASAPHASPEGELLAREAARVVEHALAKLSEERRAMLLLRLDHDLSYDDIAELMGFSLAKVKVEIHRAREVLRETLDEYQRGAR